MIKHVETSAPTSDFTKSLKKGSRVVVNLGNSKDPSYWMATVSKANPSKGTVSLNFDDGDVAEYKAVRSKVGIVGLGVAKLRKTEIPVAQITKWLALPASEVPARDVSEKTKVIRVKDSARTFPVKDIIFSYMTDNEEFYNYLNGKQVKGIGQLGSGITLHGSSQKFNSFLHNNHFFTTDVDVAIGFSQLSGHWSGKSDYTLYACKLNLKSPYVVPKIPKGQKYVATDGTVLTEREGSPSDNNLNDFLKRNTQFDGVVFEGIWDATGDEIVEVQYTIHDELVKIVKSWAIVCIMVNDRDEIPKDGMPKLLKVDSMGIGYELA